MQRILQPDPDIPWTTLQASMAGAVSGITGTFVVGPAELVKIRVQVAKEHLHKSEFIRTLNVARNIYSGEGIMGFTRGFRVTLIREVPCIALYFGLYDYCKKQFRSKDGQLSIIGQLTAGGIAGSGSWVLTYPLDVLKTRMQASGDHSTLTGCSKHLWATRGLRGFYSGVVPCAVRAFPVNAVIFAIYEWCLSASKQFKKN